ncbi:MAG: hypothetical protein KBD06_03445 [Candidatus Pacebacteria bacterium]|nr:hypothetical protein [Candidatus Paceibacterota bacterium]
MEFRILESGDEIDGCIIDDFGEPRKISERLVVIFARMRDGTYGLIFVEDEGSGTPPVFKVWVTSNQRLQRALNTSIEYPIAAGGAIDEVRIWGKDATGNFTALLYYGQKKKQDMIDIFNYV